MTTAEKMLELYLEAEAAAVEGRQFMFNGRQVMTQDLPAIIRGREKWEMRVARERSRASGMPGHALTRFE